MASKGKWNRLGGTLQQIDRAWKDIQTNTKATECDHVDVLKMATSKLLDVMCTRDKSCKDFLNKHCNVLPQFFEILKFSVCIDQQIAINIINSFIHLLSQGKALNILLGAGVVRTVTECVVTSTAYYLGTSDFVTEDLFISLYTFLLKLAVKDKNFSMISRVTGGVEASVKILKNYCTHGKIASLVVQVMKLYSASVVNCGVMVKAGIVSLNLKMIHECGQKKLQLLKYLLDLLASICKTKGGAKKAVNQGVIPLMLSMYKESHRFDHRNRNVKVRRSLLLVIKGCVTFRFGCKSVLTANGYRTLYFLGLEALDNQEMVNSLRIIIFILRKCTKNNTLPLETLSSVYTFPLPEFQTEECDDSDEYHEMSDEHCNESCDEDSDDEEEEIESTDEKDGSDSVKQTELLMGKKNSVNSSNKDLERYKEYLDELFCVHSIDDDIEENNLDDFIRIPTASLDDITGSNEDVGENSGCDNNYLVTNSSENLSPYSAKTDVVRRALSDSNIFFKQFQNLSLLDDHSERDVVCQELNDMSTFTSLENSQFDCYRNIKKKFTDLSYRPDTYKPLIIDGHLSTNLDGDEGKRNNTPVEFPDTCVNGINNFVSSICKFVQTPLPDVMGHLNSINRRLHDKKTNITRVMLFQDFSRNVFPEQLINHVVYDLDKLVHDQTDPMSTPNIRVTTSLRTMKKSQSVPRFTSAKRQRYRTEPNVSIKGDSTHSDHLVFESRFESGNLRRVIHIRQYEYDLILNADINTDNHHQWFYFQVEKMEAGVQYRFNIINCEKANSQFNFGMQPVCYSVKKAMDGCPQWERTGSDVCYYKNYYVRSGKASGKFYHTATFSIRFPYTGDTCYLSYHFPYTLTMLKFELQKLEASLSPQIYYKNQVLCQTLGGNDINLLTITNALTSKSCDITRRPYIVLTCRVHPGESNSSWIMKGVLDFLVSCDEYAQKLRSLFIFKIIPMLNPDGVVNGCHRCSLSGQDLNRQWKRPDESLHPSIYHVKSLLDLMISLKKRPLVFVDFHGHSRKKNVFLYGCGDTKTKTTTDDDSLSPNNSSDSDSPMTLDNDLYSGTDAVKMLPRIMSDIAPCFSLQNCNFAMEKSKEATARIVGFKELGITHCFTMESTYSGMDQGLYKGTQIGTRELEEMGWYFCLSLLKFGQSSNIRHYDEPEIT